MGQCGRGQKEINEWRFLFILPPKKVKTGKENEACGSAFFNNFGFILDRFSRTFGMFYIIWLYYFAGKRLIASAKVSELRAELFFLTRSSFFVIVDRGDSKSLQWVNGWVLKLKSCDGSFGINLYSLTVTQQRWRA